MYYLLNKERHIASFCIKPATAFSDGTAFELSEVWGRLPIGFKDINVWIESRKGSKHNAHLQMLMKQLGCDDNESFIRITHAAAVNDTFWIKSERENVSWEQISLYKNQFTEAISKLAFEGVGLSDISFSSTSPELTCEGSFRKCFRKEKQTGEYGSDIFLYKRGGEIGNGFEPYCEMLASEIAKIISPDNAVSYELVRLHGKLASRCNLFTDEKLGYASFAKAAETQRKSLPDVFEYFEKNGFEQQFRELLVADSLCFNQDRHAGNYGILFDNDTLDAVKMAPIFDMNLCLLPYALAEDFENIGDKLFAYAPKLGEDFTRIGQMGMNDIIRDRVKDMRDFSFSFRGDEIFLPERVKCLENIVRQQASAILSQNKLYTKDVFLSPKAKEAEENRKRALRAEEQLDGFMEILKEEKFGDGVFISECASTDTVQVYVEKEQYMLTVDFLKKDVTVSCNARTITFDYLKSVDKDFWDICEVVRDKWNQYYVKR